MEEPSSVDALANRVTEMRRKFESGEDWAFGVFDAHEARLLGGAGLHPRGSTDHLEIGYWIRTSETGRGLAVEAGSTLCSLALAHTEVERLEIHCDEKNTRSAGVARRLGFELARTFREEAITSRGAQRNTMVWALARAGAASAHNVSGYSQEHG
jgi:RimJ/RimL family protein N-acetyltransferase